ncbi:hypothetical protein CCP3SC1_270003 [Gammaproteobacteria bacterium]
MADRCARRLVIHGRVQGVGFRPFVYRLAYHYGIQGWVRNSNGVVEIHAEGSPTQLQHFSKALLDDAPPLSVPGPLIVEDCQIEYIIDFSIRNSQSHDIADIHLPADSFYHDTVSVGQPLLTRNIPEPSKILPIRKSTPIMPRHLIPP